MPSCCMHHVEQLFIYILTETKEFYLKGKALKSNDWCRKDSEAEYRTFRGIPWRPKYVDFGWAVGLYSSCEWCPKKFGVRKGKHVFIHISAFSSNPHPCAVTNDLHVIMPLSECLFYFSCYLRFRHWHFTVVPYWTSHWLVNNVCLFKKLNLKTYCQYCAFYYFIISF